MRSVIARGSCTDTIRLRELALEVDWEKNPCHTRDSSLCLYCACLFSQALSQLSYSQPFATVTALFCVHCSVRVTYATAFVMVDWVAYCIDQHYTPSDPQDDKWHYATASLCVQPMSFCHCMPVPLLTGQHMWVANIIYMLALYCHREVLRVHLEMKC